MNNIKEHAEGTVKSTLEALSAVEEMLSLSYIGKPIAQRTIEQVNDIDLILVLDKMTPRNHAQVVRIMENARDRYTKATEVSYALQSGPFNEMSVEKERNLFFQAMLYEKTPTNVNDLCLADISWAREAKTVFGKPLRSIIGEHHLTKEMLVHNHDGIEYVLGLCQDDRTTHGTWVQEGDRMRKVRMPKEKKDARDRLELYNYAILRSASNTLRYLTQAYDYGIDLRMCRDFERHLPDFAYRTVPEEAYADKRLLRNGMLLTSDHYAQAYQVKTVDFLTRLKDHLINKR